MFDLEVICLIDVGVFGVFWCVTLSCFAWGGRCFVIGCFGVCVLFAIVCLSAWIGFCFYVLILVF